MDHDDARKKQILEEIAKMRETESKHEKDVKQLAESLELQSLYSKAQYNEDGSIFISTDLDVPAPVYIESNEQPKKKFDVNIPQKHRIQYDYYNEEIEVE